MLVLAAGSAGPFTVLAASLHAERSCMHGQADSDLQRHGASDGLGSLGHDFVAS